MFSTHKQQVKVTNINVRTEANGPDEVLAADIKCHMSVSNDILSEFSPSLKSAIFKEADGPQGELDINEPGTLTALKFPNMSPFSLNDEYKGYEVTVAYGIGGKSDLVFLDSKVNSFVFTPKEGGSVDVSFRIQIHPQSIEIGKLCEFLKKQAEITLLPPEEQVMELDKAA
jgi:hypothetical protein